MEVEQTQDADALKILENIEAGRQEFEEAEVDNEVELPSDDTSVDNGEEEVTDEKKELFAGKYKSINDLKNGIKNLNDSLSDTVLNGMSDEALESYYGELQSEFSKGRKHRVEDDTKEEDETKNTDKPEEANAIPQDVWNDLDKTFNETGGLTDKQYEKLESLGIPSSIVDGYLDGLVAKQTQLQNTMYEIAGGKDEFETIKQWALDGNVDAEYLATLQSMPINQMTVAMKGIKAMYDAENKSVPSRVVGNSGVGNKGAYANQADYLRDVSDARYTRDESFRRAVDAKLSRSKF
jgi:hypothetical protein